MSARPVEDDQAAATSAFLAAMQRSHEQMQQHQKQNQGQSPSSPTQTIPSPHRKNSRDGSAPDATNGDGQNGQPPRKAQRRPSTATAKESHAASHPTDAARSSSTAATAAAPTTTATTSSDAPAGPPYICPTCQTSYSRLEYLRRHERRHQDIRPFVCECGKGFSRSDVLSRHKRQCHYHLTGEQPSPEAAEAASKKTRKPSVAKSRKRSSVTAQDNAGTGVGPVPPRSSDNGNGAGLARAGSKRANNGSPGPLSQSPPPTSLMSQPGSYSAAQPGPPPPLLPHANMAQSGGSSLPPPPPFYPHGNSSGHEHGPNANTSDYSRTYNFMTAISHALNNFGQSHSNYPPSPESSASLNSRNSSPRLHYRDTIPYTHRSGSTGSSRQSSLRKGTLDPYHAPPPWELQDGNRSSPAPGSAPSSRPGSVYGGGSRTTSNNPSNSGGPGVGSGVGIPGFSSSTSSAAPAFSYPANEFAATGSTSTGSQQSQTLAPASDANSSSSQAQATTPASTRTTEPPRFSVPTGPLSPFSGMGLSSMSPYLSAFSNARDTPLVASPGRGGAPGTPTSSLNTNVFDYTMRPPPKPASATTPSRNGSISAGHHDKAAGSSSSSGHIGSVPLKRKESAQRDEPTTPSASVAMSVSNSGTLPALADFIDDQQRSAANGLLTLLGGGGAETPSRFVRSEANADGNSSQSSTRNEGSSSMENNPGTTSANPSSNPFFDLAVTPGPEAFLLRLQGGEQERRAGLLTSAAISSQLGNMQPTISSSGGVIKAFSNAGIPTSVLGSGLDTPSYFDGLLGAQWDAQAPSGTPGQSGSVGWLMSPSINTLLATFANGMTPRGPGEGGSYFPLSRRQSGIGGAASMKAAGQATEKLMAPGFNGAAASPLRNAHTPGAGAILAKDVVQDDDDPGWLGSAALEQALDDVSNPFFIPKAMFRSCYAITHWELPPLTRLSMLAMHAQQNLLKHVPILHEPTFRLDTTPGCLAFAACMLGCHEVGRRWWAGEEVVPLQRRLSDDSAGGQAAGNAGNADANSSAVRAEVKALVDEEDGMELVKPVVMTEKMDMLMRSFAGKCKSEKDKVSVVQALMLFQTNNFLSSDATTRAIASISHGSVVSIARKAGFYDPEAKHVSRSIRYTPEEVVRSTVFGADNLCFGFSFLPSYIPNCPDEEKIWRQWCEYEGRRRTAFLIFLMDTVASLDAGLPARVELEELEHLPLPSPDSIWRASNAPAFQAALTAYSGPTFGDAMKDLLRTEDSQTPEHDDESRTDREESPGHCISGPHGPFARLVIILPILRGIVHLLQGRADKAAKPSPLEPWLPDRDYAASQRRDGSLDNDWQVELFKRALSRWRKAWDEDHTCLHASSPAAQAKASVRRSSAPNGNGHSTKEGESSGKGSTSSSERPGSGISPDPATPLFTSKTASGATPLCEDALPFYWLCHVLLGHATSRPVPRRRSPGSRSSTSPEQAFAGLSGRQSSATESGASASVDSASSSHATSVDTAATSASPPILGPVPPGAAPGSLRVPDFRSMLRFAKVFVNSSEGAHGMAGMMGGPVTALGLGLAPGAAGASGAAGAENSSKGPAEPTPFLRAQAQA